MITKENPAMSSTAEAIYVSTANADIMEQCRIREDNIAHEIYQSEKIKSLTSENKSLTSKNQSLTSENRSLTSENESLTSKNESLTSKNESLASEIHSLNTQLDRASDTITKLQAELEALKNQK